MLPNDGWRKSSRSSETNCACVEVARHERGVRVRDSKDVSHASIPFGPQAWTDFLDAAGHAAR
ncbi:DUF397 domain-containing protein [Streptomyces sp. NPDC088812]|uniref:DUF397 domain-containing protein n=1 Tax=Streptomyces sp. NPDC088812 TaxID=3365905 RepID=UPI00380BF6B9